MKAMAIEYDVERIRKIIGIVIHNAYKTLSVYHIDIEDLEGDLWVKSLTAMQAWDSQKSANLYTFVQTACEREVITKIRAAKRAERLVPRAILPPANDEQQDSLEGLLSDPDSDILSVVNVRLIIEKARDSLVPRDRTLFQLMLDGKTQEEMAREMGCSQPKISKQLAAIREALSWVKQEIEAK